MWSQCPGHFWIASKNFKFNLDTSDLLLRECLPQVCHGQPQLLLTDQTVTVTVKHLQSNIWIFPTAHKHLYIPQGPQTSVYSPESTNICIFPTVHKHLYIPQSPQTSVYSPQSTNICIFPRVHKQIISLSTLSHQHKYATHWIYLKSLLP